MVHTPRYELKGGGRKRCDQVVVQRATVFRIDARRGTVEVQNPTVGAGPYYRAMRYQIRAMIDLTKLEYRPQDRAVYWHGYDRVRRVEVWTRFWVEEFLAGLDDYLKRLGPWKNQAKRIRRPFGHMADKSVKKTAAAVCGEKRSHRKNCACSQCREWQRVILDDINENVGLGRPP